MIFIICDGCTLIQYSDNCMVAAQSISSSDALSQLQRSLHKLTFFFAKNQLNLHASKVEFIAFSFLSKNDKRKWNQTVLLSMILM